MFFLLIKTFLLFYGVYALILFRKKRRFFSAFEKLRTIRDFKAIQLRREESSEIVFLNTYQRDDCYDHNRYGQSNTKGSTGFRHKIELPEVFYITFEGAGHFLWSSQDDEKIQFHPQYFGLNDILFRNRSSDFYYGNFKILYTIPKAPKTTIFLL